MLVSSGAHAVLSGDEFDCAEPMAPVKACFSPLRWASRRQYLRGRASYRVHQQADGKCSYCGFYGSAFV